MKVNDPPVRLGRRFRTWWRGAAGPGPPLEGNQMAGRGQQVTDQDRSARPVRRLLESFHSTDSYGLVLLMIVMTYVLATTLIQRSGGGGDGLDLAGMCSQAISPPSHEASCGRWRHDGPEGRRVPTDSRRAGQGRRSTRL